MIGRLITGTSARLRLLLIVSGVLLLAWLLYLSQPELPVPLVLEFPFPAWATRASEAVMPLDGEIPDDPFEDL